MDLLPVLKSRSGSAPAPLFFDQCHHTAEASRMIAETVADWLASDVLSN
jgi:hypothetical protein